MSQKLVLHFVRTPCFFGYYRVAAPQSDFWFFQLEFCEKSLVEFSRDIAATSQLFFVGYDAAPREKRNKSRFAT